MKVLMVYTNTYRMFAPAPLGASLVASRLRGDGHDVRFLDLMFVKSPAAEAARVARGLPTGSRLLLDPQPRQPDVRRLLRPAARDPVDRVGGSRRAARARTPGRHRLHDLPPPVAGRTRCGLRHDGRRPRVDLALCRFARRGVARPRCARPGPSRRRRRAKQPVRHPWVRRRRLRQLGPAGPALIPALTDHVVGCRAGGPDGMPLPVRLLRLLPDVRYTVGPAASSSGSRGGSRACSGAAPDRSSSRTPASTGRSTTPSRCWRRASPRASA